jgi:predicted transcriptional regulator
MGARIWAAIDGEWRPMDGDLSVAIEALKESGVAPTRNANDADMSLDIQEMGSTEAVLLYVEQYIAAHDIAPTRREISEAVGICISNVQRHLMKLARLGLIEWDTDVHRSLRLVPWGEMDVVSPTYEVDVEPSDA